MRKQILKASKLQALNSKAGLKASSVELHNTSYFHY